EELFTDVKLRQAGELELERLLIGRREVGLAQRRGKESFALVVEFFVVENRIHLRAEEDAEPATLLHVCFKVGELLVGQLTNVEQEDGRKLPDGGPLQRFGGDAAAKLVAVDYLVTGAWNRNDRGVDEEAVLVFLPTARAVAVDDQHWNLVADLD